MHSKIVADRVGLFTFDPGGTTGVAWALLELRATLAETLQEGEVFSQDITGTYQEQAHKLDELLSALRYEWTVERGLSAEHLYVVSEGFSLSKIGSREKVGLYPIWISAMFEGLVDGLDTVEYQEPSTKSRSTTARMKRWSVWPRGASEHQKDARRHLCYKLNGLL